MAWEHSIGNVGRAEEREVIKIHGHLDKAWCQIQVGGSFKHSLFALPKRQNQRHEGACGGKS